MSDEHDEYLWTANGPAAPEVAALERELRSLGFRPRPLLVPTGEAVAPRDDRAEPRVRRIDEPRSRAWAPLLAGLAAAAAVFAVLLWLRGPDDDAPRDPSPHPTAQPAGQPTPDLKDPFARQPEAPSFPVPSTATRDLKDPFTHAPAPPPRPVSPDLKDPFANSAETPHEQPKPPSNKRPPNDDLVDPFKKPGDEPKPSAQPGKLHDPFTGEESKPANKNSPDLKDPFKR